jgi:hypothetical protein
MVKMANPNGTHISACGAKISEAHFHRNAAKALLEKDQTLSAAEKAHRIWLAREELTKALLSTTEGTALLGRRSVVESPEYQGAVVEAIQAETIRELSRFSSGQALLRANEISV